MTKLQQIMEDLFAVFREYAKRDGEDETLTKPEAKDLLKNQLPGLIEFNTVDLTLKSVDFNSVIIQKHKKNVSINSVGFY
uniref:S100/CaBP-9k-type calcium binding subdomain domain-containing protein n=1 Tax=Salarias fasciatus TaxID=181472 RepID=A0A672H337_SALFA